MSAAHRAREKKGPANPALMLEECGETYLRRGYSFTRNSSSREGVTKVSAHFGRRLRVVDC